MIVISLTPLYIARMAAEKHLVEVSLFGSIKKPLTYALPADCDSDHVLGRRVVVPLGRRSALGVVTATGVGYDGPVKSITSFPDLEPVLSAAELVFCRFISDYYLAPVADVIQSYLPQPLSARLQQHLSVSSRESLQSAAQAGDKAAQELLKHLGRRRILPASRLTQLRPAHLRRLIDRQLVTPYWQVRRGRVDESTSVARILNGKDDSFQPAAAQLRALEYLAQHGPTDLRTLKRHSRVLPKQVEQLESAGLISIAEAAPFIEPKATGAVKEVNLNEEQRVAVKAINAALAAAKFAPFLLYGVTGSGKTEVYIEAIKSVIASGRQAIVMVPEIGLSQALYYRLEQIFAERLALVHSRMSDKARFEVWQRARTRQISIVLGPRSALFTPFPELGLIVVDEEHDASFKQESPPPRYHARDLAVYRARQLGCPVVLGSATPSIESYYNAQTGKYQLLELSNRIDNRPLPLVRRVDLRKSFEKRGHGYLSAELREQIEATLAVGAQAMLLLNRRGFAPSVHCFACGHKLTCKNCDIALVYHKIRHNMICHLCGYDQPYPDSCPKCRSNLFLYRGIGTEKMEEELRRAFPEVGILRMDFDSTRKEGSFRAIYDKFKSGQARILLGTQMIAKGFDFPDVALVGIITADTSLELPDFRARERTFQLLTQASGRAGRHNFAGQVILQTLYPDDKTVLLAQEHNYLGFYDVEIAERLELSFPPFVHVVLLAVESTDAAHALKVSRGLKNAVQTALGNLARVQGPIAAPIHKRRSYFRFQILIKSRRMTTVLRMLGAILAKPDFQSTAKQRVMVDVDPVDMM